MKLILIIFTFIPLCLLGQKNDYVWIVGNFGSKPDYPEWGGTEINFNSNPVTNKKRVIPYGMFVNNASIADDGGNLLFYTNGHAIVDRRDSLMENGDSLNMGTYDFDHLYFGDGNWFGSIILPFEDFYYLFNTDKKVDKNGLFWPSIINYNKITIDNATGLGKVTLKNKVLYSGEINSLHGFLSACRHANGKDWWLMSLKEPNNNEIIQYLVKADTIIGPKIHTLNVKIDKSKIFIQGGMFFSQDGSKLHYGSMMSNIFVCNFDRCTGDLTNSKTIETNYKGSNFGGLMASGNGRFLYANDFENLYQFDLWSNDIPASKVLIDTLDKTKMFPFEGKFMHMQLGPDGKIYMNCYNSVAVMHRINNPDEKGKACNFVQNDVKLATNNKISLPNFPNYRLGRLKGSPCDTIQVATKDLSEAAFHLKLFPNPASTDIKIDLTLKEFDPNVKTEVVIVDVSGAIVQKYTMPDYAYIANLDISNLPSGVYGVQLRQPRKFGERILAVEKLVVLR